MKRQIYISLVLSLITVMVSPAALRHPDAAPAGRKRQTFHPRKKQRIPQAGLRFRQTTASIRLTSLYSSLFAGELPVFVDEGGDLLVQAAPEDEAFSLEPLPATFLPAGKWSPKRKRRPDQFHRLRRISRRSAAADRPGRTARFHHPDDQAGNTVTYRQHSTA